jgi:hypothetical protein
MQIMKKKLLDFLDKIALDNTIYDSVILNFRANEVECSAMMPGGMVCFVCSKLSSSMFSNYKAIGEIGVKKLEFIRGVVDKFKSEITLDVIDNVMTLSEEGKKAKFMLAEKGFIEAAKMSEEPKYNTYILVKVDDLKEVAADSRLFKEESSAIKIELKDKMLSFTSGDTDTITKTVAIKDDQGEFNDVSIFVGADYFRHIIKALTDDFILMHLGEDLPMKITEKGDKIIYTEYYVMIRKEGGDEEE